MPQKDLEIMRTVHQMCRSGDFYNTGGMTRWERAAENVSKLHPEWRPVACVVECTYRNYYAMYKYDYQEDKVKKVQGTVSEEDTPTSTFEMIGLVIAATFKDVEHLNCLLTRESTAWYPAFHRIDGYWKRLSRNAVLQSRSWQSAKDQTISLLSEIDELSGCRIPHLNKYKITPLREFTYEQNMFLIGKALKLGTLVPFAPVKSPRDMADMLSESWVFGEYIHSGELAMLCLRIKGLISYLERSLLPDDREMLDTTRQPQTEIGLDPSEKEFWESLEYVQDIDILKLKENYDNAMTLYRSPKIVQARDDEEGTNVHQKSGSTMETAGLRDQFLAPMCGSLKRTSEENLRDQNKRQKSPTLNGTTTVQDRKFG